MAKRKLKVGTRVKILGAVSEEYIGTIGRVIEDLPNTIFPDDIRVVWMEGPDECVGLFLRQQLQRIPPSGKKKKKAYVPKVGDRVRAMVGNLPYFSEGYEGTVLRPENDGSVLVQWDQNFHHGQWWIMANELSPVDNHQ